MNIKDGKIEFDIDNKTLDTLKLALSILNIDPDDFFKEYVNRVSYLALKKNIDNSQRINSRFSPIQSIRIAGDKIDNNITQSRIQRWARNKIGTSYKILRIYFDLYEKSPNNIVYRKDMCDKFIEHVPVEDKEMYTASFINNFRQMCSESPRAYGLVFKYIDNDQVALHPLNKELLLSLKNEFKD